MADYVNPIGPGLRSARIDMGVDYTGSGPLYALGSGTIRNVYNSGWPGGKFIDLMLDSGQFAGKHIFYAENINPNVTVGQHVQAGQLIGHAVGSYPYIEVGWGSGVGGQTMAAKVGQQSKSGDPGAHSTAYGVSMSNLIKSLGGPGGIMTPGGISGTVSPDYPGSVAGAQLASSTSGSALPGCVPLIGVITYALLKTEKCGWHVSRRERRKRRRENEARHRRRSG